MKCGAKEGKDTVCYKYEKCEKAYRCENVLKGIREKLKREQQEKLEEKKN